MNRAFTASLLVLFCSALPGTAGHAVPPAGYATYSFGISLATSLNSQ